MGIQGYKLQYEHLDIGSRYLLYKHKIYVLYEYKLKHNNNKIKRFHVPIQYTFFKSPFENKSIILLLVFRVTIYRMSIVLT